MPSWKIITYTATWNYSNDTGTIGLRYAQVLISGGFPKTFVKSHTIETQDPQKFQVMVDLLRNEKPLYIDVNGGYITTQREEVGEGEPRRG